MSVKKVTSPDAPTSGPTTPRTYRAAIIGTGFMGRVHSHAIRALGGEIVGVAGSSHAKAERFRASHGIARAHSDTLELVHDPDVDVVHVCTPNHLHAPLTRAALAAGKHVVCEKPLATDAATASPHEWTCVPAAGEAVPNALDTASEIVRSVIVTRIVRGLSAKTRSVVPSSSTPSVTSPENAIS